MDPSREFLGQRLNFYVALALLIAGVVGFIWSQRRPEDDDEPEPSAAPMGATAARLAAAKAAGRGGRAPAPQVPSTPGGRARPVKRRRRR